LRLPFPLTLSGPVLTAAARGKQALLHKIQPAHSIIVNVADGMNDTPALAAATVGAAIGADGTAVVIKTADVILVAVVVGRLPFAMGLSQVSSCIIRELLDPAWCHRHTPDLPWMRCFPLKCCDR
jgi:cation transport ATPase